MTAAPMMLQACVIPLYSYWVTYARIRSIYGDFEPEQAPSSLFCYSQIRAVTCVLGFIVAGALLTQAVSNPSRTVSTTQFSVLAIAIISLMFILFNSSLRKTHTPRNVISIEFVNFIIFCVFSAVLLLVSNNMLAAFFALELLGSVTLYAFFVFAGHSITDVRQQSLYATTSAVYQFILNFFGSLFFYAALGLLTHYHGGSTLMGAQARMAVGYPLLAQTAVVIALFMKLGTGP